MFIDLPSRPNGLVFIGDIRLLNDRNLQDKEPGTPVLRHWPFGKACLGKYEWSRTTRLALFDYGEKITAKIKRERQDQLMNWLHENKPKCTIVMQTRSTEQKSKDDFGDAQGATGTSSWTCLKPPDRIPEMAGCVWDAPWGQTMGVLNPVNYEYVYRELLRRHLRAGLALAAGHISVLKPKPDKLFWNGEIDQLYELRLRALKGVPLAVDIESFSDLSLITAIAFSDGDLSVSLPVEEFPIFGSQEFEAAATRVQKFYMNELLSIPCPKLFHNFSFDVPFLEAKGFPVRGAIHDTMAMHVCIYRQWPHGLQKACAQELLVPPWKSEHKPQGARQLGLTKKDAGWWTCDPEELRRYNALDSYYTWHLGRTLAPKCGVTL